MLIVLEMANNANGDVNRGREIIDSFSGLVKEYPSIDFSFKYQYRSASILHPAKTSKLCERVASTMLNDREKLALANHANNAGFKVGCTPFDEESVELVAAHRYDFVKVASACITDWPLLERVATLGLPVVASTGGATNEDVERASQFLGRRVSLTLMHCVAEYPTAYGDLRLDRIDWLKTLGQPVGLSTHEMPWSSMGAMFAVAKGAAVLEWHVGVPPFNPYSLNVQQTRHRMNNVLAAMEACEAKPSSKEEQSSLTSLRRGVYAACDMKHYDVLSDGSYTLQYPAVEGQLTANDLSKYASFSIVSSVKAGEPIMRDRYHVDSTVDNRNVVQECANDVISLLRKSGAVIPKASKLTLSHHHGLANFAKVGCGMVEVVNGNGYAKKLIVMLPGQSHPKHKHMKKNETFNVLWGDLEGDLTGNDDRGPVIYGTFRSIPCGDSVTVPAGMWHSFRSDGGCVFEEISSTLLPNDSSYAEPVDANRKTEVFIP